MLYIYKQPRFNRIVAFFCLNMKQFFYCSLLLTLTQSLFAQISAGPMLGHTTAHETEIWLQTDSAVELTINYQTISCNNLVSKKLTFSEINWFTGKFKLRNLKPESTYNYQIKYDDKVISNGTFTTLALQTPQNIGDFSFAFGSCTYVNDQKYDNSGEPFGRGLKIFESISNTNPNFMLWLGDNIYLRSGEWNSKSGIYNRYSKFKTLPELQALWKKIPHYAIWDDHDYGPNDADRSFKNKEISLQAFKDFWANPSYGINEKPGITTQFSYQDLDFFLLDNRYYRSPNNRKSGTKEILGQEQINWLIDALTSSKASFKVIAIGGQLLSDAKVWENHANYEEERELILSLIEKENLKNIIIISGDRHKTELSELELGNGIKLYEYTSSPLASKAFDSKDEGNSFQLEETHVATQNFGTISVSGKYKNRILTLNCFDASGKKLWSKIINQQQ